MHRPRFAELPVADLAYSMDTGDLVITDALHIPRAELHVRATPAGGPGGQHVNRSSTRIELWWDVNGSPSLRAEQRDRLRTALGRRLDGDGWLRIVAANRRSQLQNREEAIERFVVTLRRALHVPKARKRTRTPRAAHEARLHAKKRRGEVKAGRRPVRRDE